MCSYYLIFIWLHVIDILRQWRVDIKSTSQKTFLRNIGDDELKDYGGGLSMSHRPREGTFPHSLLKCRYIHQDSTHSPGPLSQLL